MDNTFFRIILFSPFFLTKNEDFFFVIFDLKSPIYIFLYNFFSMKQFFFYKKLHFKFFLGVFVIVFCDTFLLSSYAI